jgi:hypothetical protein
MASIFASETFFWPINPQGKAKAAAKRMQIEVILIFFMVLGGSVQLAEEEGSEPMSFGVKEREKVLSSH